MYVDNIPNHRIVSTMAHIGCPEGGLWAIPLFSIAIQDRKGLKNKLIFEQGLHQSAEAQTPGLRTQTPEPGAVLE